MFFLKFLPFVSLSLLFLGNIAAECVDISGTYLCHGGETVIISKTSDKEGLYAYTQTRNGVESPILPTPAEGVISTTTCTENRITTKEVSSEGTLTVVFALYEQTLGFHTNFVEPDGRTISGTGLPCDKQ